MRYRITIFGVIALAIFVVTALALRTDKDQQLLTVTAHHSTPDTNGQPMATLEFRLRRDAVVELFSVAYLTPDGWITNQPPPPAMVKEFEGFFSRHEARTGGSAGRIHLPNDRQCRFCFEVVEPRHGISGLRERLRYPVGYQRAGGLLNVLVGYRPVRYTGSWSHIDAEVLP